MNFNNQNPPSFLTYFNPNTTIDLTPNKQSQNFINHILTRNGQQLFINYFENIDMIKTKSKPKLKKMNENKQKKKNNIMTNVNNKNKNKNVNNKNKLQIKQQDYSLYNLIKLPKYEQKNRGRLMSNVLGNQLMRDKFYSHFNKNQLSQKKYINFHQQTNQSNSSAKIYEDLQKTLKYNKKIFKSMIKFQDNIQFSVNLAFCMFNQTIKEKFKQQNDRILLQNADKNQIKQFKQFKMKTNISQIQQLNEKFLLFKGQLKRSQHRKAFYKQLQIYKSNLISTIPPFDHNHYQFPQLSLHNSNSYLLCQFKFLIHSLLPQFLFQFQQSIQQQQQSYYQRQKTFLRSEHHKILKQKITGRLLYKYQHKINQIKIKKIGSKMYEFERQNNIIKNKFDYFKLKLRGNQKKAKQIHNLQRDKDKLNDLRDRKGKEIIKKNCISSQQIRNENMRQMIFQQTKQNLTNNISQIKPKNQSSHMPIINNTNIYKQKQKGFPALQSKNHFPAQQIAHPHPHPNQISLFRYSKNLKSSKNIPINYKQIYKNKISNNNQKISNIMNEKYFLESRRVYFNDTNNNKQQINKYEKNSYQNYANNSKNNKNMIKKSKQFDKYSSFHEQEVQISQQKTIKKSRRQTISNYKNSSQYIIENSLQYNDSPIISPISAKSPIDPHSLPSRFYPFIYQNLLLLSFQQSYLIYYTEKISLKNFLVTFLIDRITYCINQVYFIVSTLQPKRISMSQTQILKSMIKIVSSVGGEVIKIIERKQMQQLTEFSNINRNRRINYNNKQNVKKYFNQIMICKQFFNQLSYQQIIQTLEIDGQKGNQEY